VRNVPPLYCGVVWEIAVGIEDGSARRSAYKERSREERERRVSETLSDAHIYLDNFETDG